MAGIGDIEIYAPERLYPGGPAIEIEGPGKAVYDATSQIVRVTPKAEALLTIRLTPKKG